MRSGGGFAAWSSASVYSESNGASAVLVTCVENILKAGEMLGNIGDFLMDKE